MPTKLLNAKALSPVSKTVGLFNSMNHSEIEVENIDYFEEPTNRVEGQAMLCAEDGMMGVKAADFQTVIYTGIDYENSKLTGVYPVEGSIRDWPSGTSIASMISAEHIKRINTRFEELVHEGLEHVDGGSPDSWD